MFKLLENAQNPVEIIPNLLYELYPSHALSLKCQQSAVIQFNIQLDLDDNHIASLELLPEWTMKGILINSISFKKNDTLYLPIFYAKEIQTYNAFEYLFARDYLSIDSSNKIARLWIKKVL